MNEDVYKELKNSVSLKIQKSEQWIFAYRYIEVELLTISKKLNINDDIIFENNHRYIKSETVFPYMERLVRDLEYVLYINFSEIQMRGRGIRTIKNIAKPLKIFADEKKIDKKGLFVMRNGLYIDSYLAFIYKLTQ